MGRFSDYLLISDFDLTLTGHDDRVPQANVDALKAWIAEGGAFSVATGRSLMMAWRRVRDLPRNEPLITFNGAFCSEPNTGETVFSFPMPESYKALLAPILAERPDLSVELQGLEGHYVYHIDKNRAQYLDSHGVTTFRCPLEEVKSEILKFSIYAPGDLLFGADYESETARYFRALSQSFNAQGAGQFEAVNSRPNMVEVQSARCSKGKTARALADRLGRKYLVAVGDSENDLSMIEAADFGFTPSDGDPSFAARGIAQAAPCGEGTVADVIARMREMV